MEMYGRDALEGLLENVLFQMDETSMLAVILVILTICELGISPFICFVTLAGSAGLFFLMRRSLKT
jgi:hypothetical protein